ncbi:MAG: outer membrane protein assembly factor BamC [Psychroflexus sp.]
MKKITLFLFVLAGVLLTSCSTGKHMTDEMIAQNGTKTYEHSKDQVWDAVKGVLATEGYEMAYEDKDKGIINTKQKLIRAAAQGNAYNNSAQSVGYYRQYLVRIEKISEDKTKVILTPKIFQGNNDISENKIWVIEGEKGEVRLWNKFFKQVDELI